MYNLIKNQYSNEFKLPSYAQFTKAIRNCEEYLDPILDMLTRINASKKPGLYFIDSTSIPVNGYDSYHNSKWADGISFSKNMHGWYQGFKIHIIVNNDMEIVSIKLTQASIHDAKLLEDSKFTENIAGKIVGDKGYPVLEEVKETLKSKNIEIIAKQKINMDQYLNEFYAKFFKRRRVMEGVFGRLKTRFAVVFPFVRTIEAFIVYAKAAALSLILKTFLG